MISTFRPPYWLSFLILLISHFNVPGQPPHSAVLHRARQEVVAPAVCNSTSAFVWVTYIVALFIFYHATFFSSTFLFLNLSCWKECKLVTKSNYDLSQLFHAHFYVFIITQISLAKHYAGCPTLQEHPDQEVHFWVRVAESDPPQTPSTILPQARKPTRPLFRVRSPCIQCGLTSPTPPNTRKKENINPPFLQQWLLHNKPHLFLISSPKNQNSRGREEVGGVREAAELYGRPLDIIDLSAAWWDILWLKLSCLNFINMSAFHGNVFL